MKIAFVIYRDMTSLDFIGIYDPITRLKTMSFMDKEISWDICAYTEEVRDTTGMRFTPDKVGPLLDHYDMVVLPGGFGSRKLVQHTFHPHGQISIITTLSPQKRIYSIE